MPSSSSMYNTFFIFKRNDDTRSPSEWKSVSSIINYVKFLAQINLRDKNIRGLFFFIINQIYYKEYNCKNDGTIYLLLEYLEHKSGWAVSDQRPTSHSILSSVMVMSRWLGNGASVEWWFLWYILPMFIYLWFRHFLSLRLHQYNFA